ncbi:Biopolymer transport protein ExbD/TolR [Saccharicrinis carchari]|uniref:Biopolymer transport protein ExbD/TolR n=1 Tax=Saccharicrinis carchari TaxID=1168039 RepID=A0A521DS26_SACCC|nr:biopolymer transporter ExbD [Saccharicrinis carchari]SMO74507.1 Biopolymer transport protein ExbD/TolR [Saccharicrinis carchari]
MGKRDVPEVNAGSMADIAFLLLIFFLVTTTMDTDSGLARLLPPPVPENQEPPPPIKDRNVFTVLINSKNQLLVKGKPMKIGELKDAAKEFVLNPNRDEKLPEFKQEEIEFFGLYEVSKGVISLQNDNGTQYAQYLMVQNELQRAYNELRNELARRKWDKDYEQLDDDQQKAIRKIYPQKISEAEPKNIGKN